MHLGTFFSFAELNFHDLLQTPGTELVTTPSQRHKFWRTPGQIISLTSQFTFVSRLLSQIDSASLLSVSISLQ